MKLRHRIGLLVVLAGIALLVVTAVMLVLGERSGHELTGIETKYVPLIELDRDLDRTYTALTRTLEDAAGAGEESGLVDADRQSAELVNQIDEGRASILDNGGDPDALVATFRAYYAGARGVSAALVAGTPSGQLTDQIEAMRRAQRDFTAMLASATSPNRTKLAAAFTTARAAQDSILRIEIIVACMALVLMAVISWRTIRSMVRSLAAVSQGVERLARGEFSERIAVPDGDEIGDLARQANRTADRLREYRMQSDREVWIQTGVVALGDAIAGDLTSAALGKRAITQLARYLDATAAVISIAGEDTLLAYELDAPPASLPIVDGKVRVLTDDERLVGVTPFEIAVPLVHEDRMLGLLLLATREAPHGGVLDLLGRVRPTIGMALRVAESRRRAADQLVETQRQARAAEMANKELEAFSYSVSHDLRAPLRAIDGFSAALVEDEMAALSPTGLEHLGRIRAGAQRMSELIDDLLRLSRVNRAELRKERLDLTAISTSIIAELRRQSDREVEVRVAGDLTAYGDARLVRITLENLIGNAWKFTSKVPHARIEIGARDEAGERICFVRDNGAGFDMKYVDQLFAAFQRLHHEKDFAGTGVGLATVQRIVVRHGGRIWAEGEVGGGATFQFTLPDAT